MKNLPLPTKILIALAVLGVLGYLVLYYVKMGGEPETNASISYGEADVGGPFQLVTTEGKAFSERDLLGKHALVYFGYTHCPDVCPLDMNRLSMALGELDSSLDLAALVQPVFITVDPARDDQATVATFLKQYHPTFIGLTGTQAQMEVAARAYKVYYEDMLAREHTGMDMDGDDNHLINHSANIYLMGPDGKYVTHFDSSYSVSDLVTALKDRLE